MGNVLVEAKFTSVTLDQLHEELSKLKFAGYGKSTVGFKTPSPGFCAAVTLKIFKPVPDSP